MGRKTRIYGTHNWLGLIQNRHKGRRGKNWPTHKSSTGEQINHGVFRAVWDTEPPGNTKGQETGLWTAGSGERNWDGTNRGIHQRTVCGRTKQGLLRIFQQFHPHHACTPTSNMVQGTHKREDRCQGIFNVTVETISAHHHFRVLPRKTSKTVQGHQNPDQRHQKNPFLRG